MNIHISIMIRLKINRKKILMIEKEVTIILVEKNRDDMQEPIYHFC